MAGVLVLVAAAEIETTPEDVCRDPLVLLLIGIRSTSSIDGRTSGRDPTPGSFRRGSLAHSEPFVLG